MSANVISPHETQRAIRAFSDPLVMVAIVFVIMVTTLIAATVAH
jgi:hypothetical protein